MLEEVSGGTCRPCKFDSEYCRDCFNFRVSALKDK